MRIATWNVNSLNVRLPHVLDWLGGHRPDVLMLQETKLTDDRFPVEELRSAGYHAVFSGQKTYNGVAILSREPPGGVIRRFPPVTDEQRRTIAATVAGVRVVNLYVVNGQAVGLGEVRLQAGVATPGHRAPAHRAEGARARRGGWRLQHRPRGPRRARPRGMEGFDPVQRPERDALGAITALGLADTFRRLEQPERSFSWWDYRAAAFRRNRGLRIDLILASDGLAHRCTSCRIDRDARAKERPSDHAPVVAEFDL